MLKGVLAFVLTRRAIVLLGLMVFLGAGVAAFTMLNIEAYPQPAPVIIEITAQQGGLSAEEMERYYTIPMEVGIYGTPYITAVNSTSFYGLSFLRVTFKYGLGDEFIGVLSTLHKLGLDSTTPIRVGNVEVSPRDVVAGCLPDPAQHGDRMSGLTCAGTWVTGTGKDGSPREVYLHHVVDNAWCMSEFDSQAVVWQTAMNPIVALELLGSGAWSGQGVLGPEALPADPFLDLVNSHGAPWGLDERTPAKA